LVELERSKRLRRGYASEIPSPTNAAEAALSAKRGDQSKSKLKGASKQMESSMSEKQIEEFAKSEREGKPEHASTS
jgi:hypothetical protein